MRFFYHCAIIFSDFAHFISNASWIDKGMIVLRGDQGNKTDNQNEALAKSGKSLSLVSCYKADK